MNRLNRVNQTMVKPMAKEINLKELFLIVKKRFWIVAVLTVLFTLFGAIYNTFFTTLLYQTSANIIINAVAEDRETLQVIIKDTSIMEKVVQDLKLDRTPETLASQITVQNIDNSRVVSITVVDKDPVMAANIANSTAKIFKKEIPNIVGFNDVQPLSKAKIDYTPINDNQNRMIMIGFIIGLISGIGLIFFLDSLDGSVRSEADVEDYFGLPVLGKVPRMKKKNLKRNNKKKQELEIRGETIGYK